MKKGFWFWIHWLLGITLGIIIAIVGVTGAALSFRSEILSFINKDIIYVQPNGRTPLSVDELLKRADEAFPNSVVSSLTLTSELDKTARVNVRSADSANMRGNSYYIDPYTAEILPNLKGEEFFALMVKWHRWLGDRGGVGKQVVAIATVALIIISLTGLYLYWPFLRHKFFSALTIDFKKKGRGFLYKLHSVFGVWTLIFVLLMSFTGLFWSYEWYRNGLFWLSGVERPNMQRMQTNVNVTTPQNMGNISKVSNGQNTENFSTRNQNMDNLTRQNTQDISGHNHKTPINTKTKDNAANNFAKTANGQNMLDNTSEEHFAVGEHTRKTQAATDTNANLLKTEIDENKNHNTKRSEIYLLTAQAYELFKDVVNNDYITASIALPQIDNKIFTFSYYPSNPAHSRASNQLQIDMEKKEVIRHSKYEDKKLGEKFMSSMYPLHSGDFFGMPGLILYCISSLAMALFAITGYMLYYGRFIKNRKKAKSKNA
jgi:sulfite reductase (NADPH) flavoprotein alpha-component